MKIYENSEYNKDVNEVANLNLPWKYLYNKTLLLSGATGLIGSCLIDVIMRKNADGMKCRILALGRNSNKAYDRFKYCWEDKLFNFISHDIKNPITLNDLDANTVDYVLHLASNTHPVQYSMDPIGTITTNIIGTYNMLEFAKKYKATRCLFASSNEIYGENRGDIEKFDEDYCGYINSNTVRAGYPESKRCSEALCQAYIKQENMNIVIPRLTRSYGPTMLMTDTKAISQFIRKGIKKENIILKSAGNQYYSYTYVTDAVAGILTILLKGKTGEAYNIADTTSDIKLKDLAGIIAEYVGEKVVFELPDEIEMGGYSTATKARINGQKLQKLGWKASYDIQSGVEHTIDILKQINNVNLE